MCAGFAQTSLRTLIHGGGAYALSSMEDDAPRAAQVEGNAGTAGRERLATLVAAVRERWGEMDAEERAFLVYCLLRSHQNAREPGAPPT